MRRRDRSNATLPVVLLLALAGCVRWYPIHVVNEAGEPEPGAVIRGVREWSFTSFGDTSTTSEKIGPWLTDANGIVLVGRSDYVCARAHGWPPQTYSGQSRIVIGPPRTLRGRLVFSAPSRCPFATVSTRTPNNCDPHAGVPVEADGSFVLTGLGPSGFVLDVHDCGQPSFEIPPLPPGETTREFRVHVRDGSVRVTDEHRVPVAGASVWFGRSDEKGSTVGPFLTGADGSVPAPEGSLRICARRAGWPATSVWSDASHGSAHDDLVVLDAPRVLTGTVTADRPECMRARISVPETRGCWLPPREIVADDQGRFEITELGEARFDLTVESCGLTARKGMYVPPQGGHVSISVVAVSLKKGW